MKQFILLLLILFSLIANSQSIKPGDKIQGGIVFDTKGKTKFIVAEKELGQMSWDAGKKACEDLVVNGFDDWRLPTRGELEMIYYEIYEKKRAIFSTGYFWSGSENKGILTLAWSFDFLTASETNTHHKNNNHYILAVRSFKDK